MACRSVDTICLAISIMAQILSFISYVLIFGVSVSFLISLTLFQIPSCVEENLWLHLSTDEELMRTLKVLSAQLDHEFSQHQILRELLGIIVRNNYIKLVE